MKLFAENPALRDFLRQSMLYDPLLCVNIKFINLSIIVAIITQHSLINLHSYL
jgi:hypothetical protein